jgi:flagellar P-ring protein FlgI
VVISSAVRVGPAAISHGKLTVRIDENQRVSQPAPLSQGSTQTEQHSSLGVEEEKKPMFLMPNAPKLSDVVKAVNAMGASPSDLVAILEALKEAGSLKADLVIL